MKFKKISLKIGYYWTLCDCQLIAYRTSLVAVYKLRMKEDLPLIILMKNIHLKKQMFIEFVILLEIEN